ncbi:hypothetical protein [Stakelama pacifica]|nr:hypothetical protein [Stakelama pacifica]
MVDAIDPPIRGETWIGDNHLDHFGLRVWAGKKGGGKAYAIRLRDRSGVLVRETFRPERDYALFWWRRDRDKPLGHFLNAARTWARDRIAFHLGLPTSADRSERAWQRRKAKVLSTMIGDAFDHKIARLRRSSKDHLYLDQISNLVGSYVPKAILASTFDDVPIRELAEAISQPGISRGNGKVLRSFVGGVFKDAGDQFGPLRRKLKALQRQCAKNLDSRKSPPFPEIFKISDADYQRLFDALEADKSWRQALAIRLYFATEARLQPILRARWSNIIDSIWYPYLPDERKLWFVSRQPLRDEGMRILALIERRHREEQLASPYLFPSPASENAPIKTVQRHWQRCSQNFGWNGLLMSHVVLRHRPRANHSYSLEFYQRFSVFDRF